jgi:hypothetical protein
MPLLVRSLLTGRSVFVIEYVQDTVINYSNFTDFYVISVCSHDSDCDDGLFCNGKDLQWNLQ